MLNKKSGSWDLAGYLYQIVMVSRVNGGTSLKHRTLQKFRFFSFCIKDDSRIRLETYSLDWKMFGVTRWLQDSQKDYNKFLATDFAAF